MILIDANPIVYASDTDSPQFRPSEAVIDVALTRHVPGVLVPQVLLEFWSTVTSPRRSLRPLTPEQAWRRIEILRSSLPVLDVSANAIGNLETLVRTRRSTGASIYDLFLVAQMRSHGIGQICTYNTADFSGIPGIEALTPEQALTRYGLSLNP